MEECDYLNSLAKEYFNINYLFPYQRLVISNILSCSNKEEETVSNQIVILPTGYGKSLCYMLPALLLSKPTIILSPLLSLIKDQARRLESSGIDYSILTGSLSKEEKLESINKIKSGKIKILITNPESLSIYADLLGEDNSSSFISHFVIDEAHTIPEWGESFREALLETKNIIAKIKPDCITAFTATATPYILSKIKTLIFENNQINLIEGNPDRPNISYSIINSICIDKDTTDLVQKSEKPLLIFCTSRTDTEITSRLLRRKLDSNDIYFYHAELEIEEKKKIEEWFFKSETGILIATCAFGMGIDKANIRTVIHRNPPQSVEAYLQEAGRAGRDTKQAKAILIFDSFKFLKKNKQIIEQDLNNRITQILEYAENNETCRREKLLSFFAKNVPVCTGCDICNGSLKKEISGISEISGLISQNRLKLRKKEILEILTGTEKNHSNYFWYRFSNFYKSLKSWEIDEVKEAIETMEDMKLIKKGRYLWKDLYRDYSCK